MKKAIALLSLVTVFGICELNAQTEAEMKTWQSYMTPGEVHKMLAQYDGEWTDEITMWMDPATPPTKSTTSSKSEMIMGGRYQVTKTSGNMMGMPFEGMSLIGYDNAKKTFSNVWVDNFGTGTMSMVGTWDDATKSITFKGNTVDPMTGKDIQVRQVVKYVDKDTQKVEMYDTKKGTESKTMELVSTRKK